MFDDTVTTMPVESLTLVYFVTALIALVASLAFRSPTVVGGRRRNRRFWLSIAFVLVTLGVLRHYELHTDVTLFGRRAVSLPGVVGERRIAQLAVIWYAIGAGGLALMLLVWMMRELVLSYVLALIGLLVLAIVIGIQLISMQSVDQTLRRSLAGIEIGTIFESAALIVIATAAMWVIYLPLGGMRWRRPFAVDP